MKEIFHFKREVALACKSIADSCHSAVCPENLPALNEFVRKTFTANTCSVRARLDFQKNNSNQMELTNFFNSIDDYKHLNSNQQRVVNNMFLQHVYEEIEQGICALTQQENEDPHQPHVQPAGDDAGLRYASGYAIRKLLKKHQRDEVLSSVLKRLQKSNDDQSPEDTEWFVKAVDRGGLVNPTNELFEYIKKIQQKCKVFIEKNAPKQEFLDAVHKCEQTKAEWTVLLGNTNDDKKDILIVCMVEFIDSIYNFCARAYSKKITHQNYAFKKIRRETKSQRKQLQNIVNQK